MTRSQLAGAAANDGNTPTAPSSFSVFAFPVLSLPSQLSLASRMTSSSIIDFAALSPAFAAFLGKHEREIVLRALRTQYGFIPSSSSTSLATWELLCSTSKKQQQQPVIQKRSSNSTGGGRAGCTRELLVSQLSLVRFLAEEETLPKEGRRILEILKLCHRIRNRAPPSSSSLAFSEADEEALQQELESLYTPGIRGLLRYTQKYTSLTTSTCTPTTSPILLSTMTSWLQTNYTPYGITEILSVYAALCDSISFLLLPRDLDPVCRRRLEESLVCGMEVVSGLFWDRLKEKLADEDCHGPEDVFENVVLKTLCEVGVMAVDHSRMTTTKTGESSGTTAPLSGTASVPTLEDQPASMRQRNWTLLSTNPFFLTTPAHKALDHISSPADHHLQVPAVPPPPPSGQPPKYEDPPDLEILRRKNVQRVRRNLEVLGRGQPGGGKMWRDGGVFVEWEVR